MRREGFSLQQQLRVEISASHNSWNKRQVFCLHMQPSEALTLHTLNFYNFKMEENEYHHFGNFWHRDAGLFSWISISFFWKCCIQGYPTPSTLMTSCCLSCYRRAFLHICWTSLYISVSCYKMKVLPVMSFPFSCSYLFCTHTISFMIQNCPPGWDSLVSGTTVF